MRLPQPDGNGELTLSDELPIKHKAPRRLPPPFELTQQRYLLVNRSGEEHVARFYTGECPDCGIVLYAIVDPNV
jgi:hypothetical protein